MSKPKTPKHVPRTKWERLYRELEAEQTNGDVAVALKLVEQQGGNPRLDRVKDLTVELTTKLPCSVQYMAVKAQLDQAISDSLLPNREELIEHLDYVAVWLLENPDLYGLYGRLEVELIDLLLLRARLLHGMSYVLDTRKSDGMLVTVLGDTITRVPTEEHLSLLEAEAHEAAQDE